MLCKRIIGVVMVENGLVVRRKGFKTQSIIGRSEVTVKYLQNWDVDEVFLINVGNTCNIVNMVQDALKRCFLPVTVGGSISSFEEASHYIRNGADKVVIGKHKSKELIESISDKYGDQSIVLSIDDNHKEQYDMVKDWPMGDVVLHDKTRDGMGQGLNLEIAKIETKQSKILMGGVGKYEDIIEGLKVADGVAVGNIFHFKEISAKLAKKEALKKGLIVRC